MRETLERLGLPAELERLADSAGYDSVNALALAVGVGDQLVVDLVHDMLALDNGQEPNQPDEPDCRHRNFARPHADGTRPQRPDA